jgi:hypothetical protein
MLGAKMLGSDGLIIAPRDRNVPAVARSLQA